MKEKLLNTILDKQVNIRGFEVIEMGYEYKAALRDLLTFDEMPSDDLLLEKMTEYVQAIDVYCRNNFNLQDLLKEDENINVLLDMEAYMVKTLYDITDMYTEEERLGRSEDTKLVNKTFAYFPFYKDGIIVNAFADM